MEKSDSEWVYRNEANFPDFKKEMLEACRTGNLSQLQQIYQAHDIQPGVNLEWMEGDKPPTIFTLNITAIIHEHVPILQYLLSMHPTSNLNLEMVVLAIVDHPNLEMLDVIVKHQPDIINIQYRHSHTFLTDACQGGGSYNSPPNEKTLPLIHYLLDKGADPRMGPWRDCGALCTALEFKRPLEILEKMMDKGGTVDDFVFSAAIKNRRLDAVKLFFDRAILRGCSTKMLLKDARETHDKKMVSLVEAEIAKFTGQELPKWWQVWSLPFRPSRNYLYRPPADEQDEWDPEV